MDLVSLPSTCSTDADVSLPSCDDDMEPLRLSLLRRPASAHAEPDKELCGPRKQPHGLSTFSFYSSTFASGKLKTPEIYDNFFYGQGSG